MPPYNASDPTATFLNSSCLDFLLIEVVPLTYRVTNELESAAASADALPPSAPAATAGDASSSVTHNGPASSTGAVTLGGGNGPRKLDEDEERDAVFYRLEMLGYRVGQGLVER